MGFFSHMWCSLRHLVRKVSPTSKLAFGARAPAQEVPAGRGMYQAQVGRVARPEWVVVVLAEWAAVVVLPEWGAAVVVLAEWAVVEM